MNVNGVIVKWFYEDVDAITDPTLLSRKISCNLETATGILSRGEAFCSPNDTYDKDFGRKLALTRAMKGSELTKDIKSDIWEAYRTATKTPRW